MFRARDKTGGVREIKEKKERTAAIRRKTSYLPVKWPSRKFYNISDVSGNDKSGGPFGTTDPRRHQADPAARPEHGGRGGGRGGVGGTRIWLGEDDF